MASPWINVSGTFFRSIVAERQHLLLAKPRVVDCGRYHAPGQSALYMSPKAEWAQLVAIWYMQRDAQTRVLFPLHVSEAKVLDLGDETACRILGIDGTQADQSWRKALEEGRTPPSWGVADAIREAGGDGLIDHSRMFQGAWHVTLFGWNEPGRPEVTCIGEGMALPAESGIAMPQTPR